MFAERKELRDAARELVDELIDEYTETLDAGGLLKTVEKALRDWYMRGRRDGHEAGVVDMTRALRDGAAVREALKGGASTDT